MASEHETPTFSSSFDPGLPKGQSSSDCPFCSISSIYAPYDPQNPPDAKSRIIDPNLPSPGPSTFMVLSTPQVMGFLDIMPLSVGHVLVCPRNHRPKLTDASPAEAAELGRYLRVLSAAVVRATGIKDWNVVQNNGAAAAQVVPHLHFHIIPRPELRDKRSERFTATMFGRGQRDDLDEGEAVVLAEKIRQEVAKVMKEDQEQQRISNL